MSNSRRAPATSSRLRPVAAEISSSPKWWYQIMFWSQARRDSVSLGLRAVLMETSLDETDVQVLQIQTSRGIPRESAIALHLLDPAHAHEDHVQKRVGEVVA